MEELECGKSQHSNLENPILISVQHPSLIAVVFEPGHCLLRTASEEGAATQPTSAPSAGVGRRRCPKAPTVADGDMQGGD